MYICIHACVHICVEQPLLLKLIGLIGLYIYINMNRTIGVSRELTSGDVSTAGLGFVAQGLGLRV